MFDQLYTYDSLNRITSAEEKTGTTVNWNQTYKFDRYGNRNFNESLTTTLPKGCTVDETPVVCEADKKTLNPALNASDNKMAAGQGWSYDAAGNVIGDPQGRSFIYDAENKQVEVENSLEESIGKYWFDGDGKRIKKDGLAPNGQPELTVFVYDAGGKLIGEYSTNVETAAPKVQYLTADHLGSPRINTDQNGTVTSRTDYMPYGEEIIALGGRNADEAYSPDDIRKGFTGYERDNESGLHYAKARQFASYLGRYLSSDAFEKDSNLNDPQSWAKYSYVRNNPLIYVDPKGEKAEYIVSVDEKKKTGTIVVKASFTLYKQSGKFTKDEWKREVAKFKDQVTKSFTSTKTSSGGITYTIKTDFTFRERETEAAAEKSGADNIVGLVKAGSMDVTKALHGGTSTILGTAYRVSGEDFDRILMVTGSGLGNLGGHETGHTFGAPYNAGNGIMSGSPNTTNMTDDDFNLIFSQQVRAQEFSVRLMNSRLVNGNDICSRSGGCANPFKFKVRAPEESPIKYPYVPKP